MTRLLMIHTGGTISMVPSEEGLVPRAGVAEKLARSIVRRDLPGVALDICSFDPLLDSADITPAIWNRLTDCIRRAQQSHDGVVVTHGTDTLAYTAAALTFALRGLVCPVVVTGAMRPPGCERSDATRNLRDAFETAVEGARGVSVQFAGRSMVGDRVVKLSSSALDAFRETEPQHQVSQWSPAEEQGATTFADTRVAVLTVSPCWTAEAFDAALACLDGVVLRCYGSGTVPTDPRFRSVLSSRIRQGLTVMAISQCAHGGLRPREYGASAALSDVGAIDGGSLTAEAALAKLALMLSVTSSSQRQKGHT